MLDAGTVRQMPIRLPEAETIRREIAERAAHVSSASMEHYLALIGPVEPAVTHGSGESAWRLAYYQGSREEHDAIERAVGQIQRETPLMRAD